MITHKDSAKQVSVRARILAACDGEWVCVRELPATCGAVDKTVRKIIAELEDLGEVATRSALLDDRWKLQVRKVGPDYIPPLYETTADHLPLASCWGGYTVKSGEQPCRL